MKRAIFLLFFLLTGVFILPIFTVRASVQDEINARNKQIEQIQQQIDEYQKQIEENNAKAQTLATEIGSLNAQVNKILLEIKSLALSINQTTADINNTQNQIDVAQKKINLHKEVLAKYIQVLYQVDKQNLTEILFKNSRLSDFFNNLKNLQDAQSNLKTTIVSIKNLKVNLEQKESDLEDKKSELQTLKGLQEAEKDNLSQIKKQKDSLLKETKGQEARFQQLVKQSKEDINRIRDQVTYLQQNGVSVEDAIKFGQLAALRVGIRPGFLIAILEVESGLGKNVGTGNWEEDMYNCYLRLKKPSRAEAEKTAFFEIISKLGLDPNAVKVSHEPNYGCGGALGPAQFLPTIWLAYEDDVANLTNHRPPSPWNIEDAFMASAVKLSRAGATAKTRASEIAAAKAYLSGKPNCGTSICRYYSNAVLNKAAIIEQNL